jgi:membrane protease YdiL (CAAX protease family)
MINERVLITYGVIYIVALGLAIWRRKTFPLGDALMLLLIAGVGFTGLVYLIVPQSPILTSPSGMKTSELMFVLAYLVFIAFFLARKKSRSTETDSFIKKRFFSIGIKLLFFVLIPLLALRLFWGIGWVELAFSAGNVSSQLISAALLLLLLGGFNLLVGSAAAPIRAHRFNAKQLTFGFGFAFLWDIVEAGLVEEFFFRVFLQARLVSYLHSPIAGIAAASLLFGLAHAPGIYLRKGDEKGVLGARPTLLNSVLYSILALSPAGWFTGLLFWRTQSLLAPILLHGGVDAVASTAEFIQGLGFLKRLGNKGSAVRLVRTHQDRAN